VRKRQEERFNVDHNSQGFGLNNGRTSEYNNCWGRHDVTDDRRSHKDRYEGNQRRRLYVELHDYRSR
jgi:hypothetical protein